MNKKIYEDLEKARNKNECRCSTIKGVRNLSRSDLDQIEFYADLINRFGSFQGYRSPDGNVAEVLTKYGYLIEDESDAFSW